MQGGEEADQQEENATLIDEFIDAIKQEQLHPALLPHRQHHTSTISILIRQQRQKLKEFLEHDSEELNKADKNFRYMIYSSQIEKIDYLLKLYSRIRLKKIQLHCFHLTKLAQQHAHLLSTPEQNFLRKYSELRYQHYHQTVFKQFMKNYRDFKGIEVLHAKKEEPTRERRLLVDTKQSQLELRGPDTNEFVFARVLHNPEQARFGVNVKVSNMGEGHSVVPANAVLFAQFKVIEEAFPDPKQYRLL